ncbi:hypothetical protein CQW23_24226 [Capsicum baccatum]|uniref:Peptidase S9 prolyl oligopeptidase catalytic domain-containing protein n=1 Tax=Capsicum baccatum TaxID=33114 RepID=A0A2G2VU84_CAPBA|nr:hypothetical protein CQW23_24226 [Capsicum baccatum]
MMITQDKEKKGGKDNLDSGPVPITPDYGGPVVRYADGVFDGRFNRYIAVREDHREFDAKPTTEIVSIALNEPKVLISGNDFLAFPRMDMKGECLAWIEWSHPNMHWDKAELWVGYISESGDIDKRVLVAGGCPTIVESPTEPLWSSKGRIRELFFITDRNTGFWNIHKWTEDKNEVLAIHSLNAEFTRPFWVFGNRCYDIIERKEESAIIACSYRQHGKSYLGVINQAKNSFCSVDIPFTYISNILASGQILYIEGASSVLPTSLAKVILDDHMSDVVEFSIMWSSSSDIDKYISYFSLPELIEFPTDVAGQNAYAYFYPPCNPEYNGSQEEKPPLLLESHGGPTGEAYGTLSLSIQYWTSRGWAFVDVNYGGSTGYGRAYRERLLGKWGIVDINDCCSCAKYLVDEGKVDGKRLCITGCSAGGYTTLASLAFRDTFRAGASLFGIADLKSLSDSMHKFESHYIINLGGNEIALNERSPINFVDRFSCPIILFQGLEDTVVQPEQARKIYHALKERGLPVALVEYEGESHGFRKVLGIIMVRSKGQDKSGEEMDDKLTQIQDQLQQLMEGMLNMNAKNQQTDKELLEIREALGSMAQKGKGREPNRAESTNGMAGSMELQQEERPKESHHNSNSHGNYFTKYSRLEFPRFSGQDLRTWLYKVDQFFSMDEVPFEQRVKVASIHFDGEAIAWHGAYMRCRNSVVDPTWTEYVISLNERFGDGFEDPMEALMNLR